MLSVRGATKRQVEVLASRVPNPRGPISIAVTNSSNNHVLSGYPEDLAAFEVEAGKEHKRQQTLRDEKVRGGAVFGPVLEYLEVTLPFHSPLMADAVEQAVAWAHACGFKETRTRCSTTSIGRPASRRCWNPAIRPSCGSSTSARATRSASSLAT